MMRDMLAITAREIREKRLLFAGAALCAVIVMASPLLPGVRNEDPAEVMTTAAFALSILFLILTPVFLGMGVIGRDLEEHRMGFYLARPVSTSSVWSGKTLGAILIALGLTATVVLIPTLLGQGLLSLGSYAENLTKTEEGMWVPAMMDSPLRNILLVSLLLLALAQFLGLGLRTRSPWLLLDFVILDIVFLTFMAALRPFLLNGAMPDAITLSAVFVALTALLILAGNAIGLQRGRSDLHRTHKWTSIVTAGLLLIGGLVIAGWSGWSRTISLAEIEYATVIDAPAHGPWIAVSGAKSPEWNAYWTDWLVNTESGTSIEVPNSLPLISEDGTVAAIWTRETISPPSARLSWIDLAGSGQIHRTEVAIPLEQEARGFARWRDSIIAPDGGRVAWIEDDTLHVHDLREDQSLFTAKIPESQYSRLVFTGESELYVFTRARADGIGGWTIRRVDLDDRSWTFTGTLPEGYIHRSDTSDTIRFTPRNDDPSQRRQQIRNIASGALVESIPARFGLRLTSGGFLVLGGGATPALQILDENNVVEKTIEIPSKRLTHLSEVARGIVAVRVNPGETYRDARTYLVDLESSEVKPLEQGLHVLTEAIRLGSDDIIVGDGHNIFLLEPQTMRKRLIAGKG